VQKFKVHPNNFKVKLFFVDAEFGFEGVKSLLKRDVDFLLTE